jgi:hypothetical protein
MSEQAAGQLASTAIPGLGAVMGGLSMLQGIGAARDAASQQQAQQIAQQLEYDRAQFAGRMQVDTQNRAAYQANARNFVNNKKIAEAALNTYAINTYRLNEQYKDNQASLTQQQKAVEAGFLTHSVARGLGRNSQTAKLLGKQIREKGLDSMLNLANKNRLLQEQTKAVYQNALNQRRFTKVDYTTFIPGAAPAPAPQAPSPISGAIQGLSAGLESAQGIQNLFSSATAGG